MLEKRGHHHPKADIVVPVVRIVPVAVRTTRVPLIIVERATAQNTVALVRLPPQYFRLIRKGLPH